MNQIILGDTILKYQIAFKNNKNTYFYFKKNGYIQINASKYQKKKDIIKFIKKNKESFILKYNKMLESSIVIDGYRIWGLKYKISVNESSTHLVFNHEQLEIIEPNRYVDQLKDMYKNQEKKILMTEANNLKDKYMNNRLIDISKIKIKTRSTKSRFGSCNARLKTINLNLELVHYDKKYIEYVFLHEIAHLIHQNHSSDFYLLLSKICPNYKELKKELNRKFKR